jgi:glycerol-3-phosphate O-acyltransferase / dihydroxyacetone phosphate acyltransferase
MDLIYRFCKAALFPIMRIFYRRVYFSNRQNVPQNKPILLACNHPNSFLDGISVSYYLLRRTYVLVRGDVFKKGWADYLLRSYRLLPIFRSTDGEDPKENRKNNNITFDNCYALFQKNYAIIIFSEAIAKLEKRLRPLKKGTARLAFDSMEKSNWEMDLCIVPTSLNYTHFKGFRNELMIDFDKPIMVKDYKQAYLENSGNAILQLTKDIEEKLSAGVIICEDPENDDAFDVHSTINRNQIRKPFFGYWFTKELPVKKERAAAVSFAHSIKDEGYKSSLLAYQQLLHKMDLTDKSISKPSGLFWKIPFVLICTIPAAIGMFLHFIPYKLAAHLTPKMIKKHEFYDSILVGLCLVLGMIYTLILMLIGLPIFGLKALLVIVLIKVFAINSLFVWEAWQDIIYALRKSLIASANPEKIKEVMEKRQAFVVQ